MCVESMFEFVCVCVCLPVYVDRGPVSVKFAISFKKYI